MFAGVRGQLTAAGILPEHLHKQGAAVISELLSKEASSRTDYIALTGPEIGRELLETNVFAFHFYSGQVTFQSTVVKRYCEEEWKVAKDLGGHE